MSDTIIVESTIDYTMFKRMAGNRKIDWPHVERLRASMEKNPEWLKRKPIEINENNFVIDGQHRLEAAKLVGHPVYYTVTKGALLDDTRNINSNQKHWSILDWAQSFADSGRQDYIWLLRAYKEYPKLSLSALVVIMSNKSDFDVSRSFRAGDFKIDNYDDAMERAKMAHEIRELSERTITTSFWRTLMRLYREDEQFDIVHFKRKLEAKPELLTPGASAKENLRAIEDVYNYHMSNITRFYK